MSDSAARQAPRRLGRPPKAEARDTRAALLEAALALFARHGYAGTSIRAIAQAVGASESVLYKHFANKQAIFDEVLYQAGAGLLVDQLAVVDHRLAAADPPAFLRAVTEQLLRAWDRPRARRLTSVLARSIGDTHTRVIAAAGQVQQEMAGLFARWMQSGQLPADRGTPEQLAWELFAPSAFVRLLYLHAEAAPATRRAGHQLLRRHLEFFIATVFATRAQHPLPGVPGQG
jgi:AcrR family transcriptional regulator